MALSSALASVNIYGCPYDSYLSLVSVCSATNVPPCATATSINYDAACCGALTSYGISVYDCFTKQAPTCLNTSAFQASLTAPSASNPCAAFATPAAGGSSPGSGPAPTTATPTAAAGGSTATGGSPSTAGSATGSGASATATKASAAGKVTAKVYLGLALVGALAVLNL